MTINPILRRLDSPDLDTKTRDRMQGEIRLAGAETLLIELRQHYKFGSQETKTDVFEGKTVLVMHGAWKNGPVLQELDPPASRPAGFLPPYLPGDATLYLGKDDY